MNLFNLSGFSFDWLRRLRMSLSAPGGEHAIPTLTLLSHTLPSHTMDETGRVAVGNKQTNNGFSGLFVHAMKRPHWSGDRARSQGRSFPQTSPSPIIPRSCTAVEGADGGGLKALLCR